MKITDHLAETIETAGHGAQHIVLIAVVYADVGVRVPDENGVNASVTLLQVVKITVHSVAVSYRIVESAIFHHHLGLNETGLRPLQRGIAIVGVVETHADAVLEAPVLKLSHPF